MRLPAAHPAAPCLRRRARADATGVSVLISMGVTFLQPLASRLPIHVNRSPVAHGGGILFSSVRAPPASSARDGPGRGLSPK
eukprot:6643392-Pyramimonas_sp.AAC.1